MTEIIRLGAEAMTNRPIAEEWLVTN